MSGSDSYYRQQYLSSVGGLASHNDYLQTNPLSDALALGFELVEADIFLQSGELRVAHDSGSTVAGRTLQSLYLNPIAALSAGSRPKFLSIDLKDNPSQSAYDAASTALQANGAFSGGAVKVIFSGNLPASRGTPPAWITFASATGRSAADYADAKISLISVQFSTFSSWDGAAPVPLAVLETLRIYANDAHRVGKMAHTWDAPESEASYQAQYDAGMDLIAPGGAHPPGADNISRLASWRAAL